MQNLIKVQGMKQMFAWNNGEGPWGKPTGKAPTSSNRTAGRSTGPAQPDLEDVVAQMAERLKGYWKQGNGGNGGSGGGGFGMPGGIPISWMMVGGLALWLASGFFIVGPDQQGVITRFGAYQRTVDPGLHFHAPWPLESVRKLPVQRVNQLEIGFREGGMDVSPESLMLTQDQNIVDMDFTVQWRIENPAAYLFNLADPDQTVADVAESVMRETIGRHTIDDALTDKKIAIATQAQNELQRVLNRYGAGVRVVGLQLQQVNPPAEVIEAFRDVQAANADAEKLKNEAMGYANQIVPIARGEAARLLQEAEGYQTATVAAAEGDAARFNAQVGAYQANPQVTRQRLYLETMEQVLPGIPKVVVTGRGTQSVLPYLPLDKLPRVPGNEGGR